MARALSHLPGRLRSAGRWMSLHATSRPRRVIVLGRSAKASSEIFLVLLALCAVALGGTPALAFKNIEGCDIVAFAATASPVPIPPERWQAYRDAIAVLLGRPLVIDAARPCLGADRQPEALLAPDKHRRPIRAICGDSCRVLVKLNEDAVEALLDEVAQSTPAFGHGSAAAGHRAALRADRQYRALGALPLEPGPDVDAGGAIIASSPARSCRSSRQSGSKPSRSRISDKPPHARTPAGRDRRLQRKPS